MAKTITSKQPKESKKGKLKILNTHEPKMLDKKFVLEILQDCLAMNDLEAFEDVLLSHLRTVSITKMSRLTKLGRQTFYDILNPRKKFNPTLKTIGAIFKELAA